MGGPPKNEREEMREQRVLLFLWVSLDLRTLYGAGGQGWSLPLVFFWRPRLRLGPDEQTTKASPCLKTFKLFLDEIPIVFFGTPIKKN